MKQNKKWSIIIIMNLGFYIAFLLGFLFEKEDPMQVISFIELAFLLFPIPFSIFYGVYSVKLTNEVFLPNILYSLLMFIFTAWLWYYNGDGFNPILGLFFCLISLIASFITLSVTKSTQKQNEEFEDE